YPLHMIYQRRADDTRTEERQDKLGFKTTTVSRPRLISTFERVLYERSIHLHHRQTIRECQTFVIKDGRVEADKHCHDDLVFGAMLAVEGMLTAPPREVNAAYGRGDAGAPFYSGSVVRTYMPTVREQTAQAFGYKPPPEKRMSAEDEEMWRKRRKM